MTLKEHLENCGCTNVQNVTVTFGRGVKKGTPTVYQGCLYHNPKIRPDEPNIVLIGQPPQATRVHVCYPHSDGREWYMACHLPQDTYDKMSDELRQQYHPFGPTFVLSPWTCDDKIDQYERFNYLRIPMTQTLDKSI